MCVYACDRKVAKVGLEAEIRTLARAGHSKQHTRELLGFCRAKFDVILGCMEPVKWPGPGKSILNRAAANELRGVFTERLKANQKRATAANKANFMRVVARGDGITGMVGTITDLVKHYRVDVSSSTVRRRIALDGMTLEAAIFTPPSSGFIKRGRK